MGNACSRRKNRGSLADLGIGEEYDWEGLAEDKIDIYEEYKEKVLDAVREKLGEDDPDDESFLLGKVSQDERETLKGLLLRRAIALVHVLMPIEEQRKGQSWLQNNGAMPPTQWASYQRAEELCGHELNAIKRESMLVAPGVPPNVIIQTAVRLYHQHGKDGVDEDDEGGGVQVHPDAKELPTIQLRVMMPREKGQSLGLQVMQIPPAEQRKPGQQSRLVVTGFVEDGFAIKHNEKQDDLSNKLMEGDAIVGIADGSVPPDQAKPVVNDAEAILQFMAKDDCAVTPLALFVIRILGPALRFRLGARVKARCGEAGWLSGQVIRVWEEDRNGEKKPYVIRLDNGRVVVAPRDHEDCVIADEPPKEQQQGAGGADKRSSKSDNWAKGMFGKQKPSGDKDKEEESETQDSRGGFKVHPDAKDVPVVKLQVVLKRESGESLGIALHHEPPLERRVPGQPSCLFVSNVLPGGFAMKHNQSMENPAQCIQKGDRIMAVLDGSAPEDQRKPVGDDSAAMLEVITRDKNAVTPLVFFIVRALGPPLRFTQGQRVKANCGPDGWLNGKVIKLWEQTDANGGRSPYIIKIEGQDRAVVAGADNDSCVVKADPRFKVDDVVMVNRGRSYTECKVLQVAKDGSEGVYKVREAEGSDEFWVPSDVDQIVRAVARFKKGDKVKANVGGEFVPGIIEELYHPGWVYAIKLEKDDNMVTAPEDLDQFVQKSD